MRWSTTEPKMVPDGVRSVIVVDGMTYWVDHRQMVTPEDFASVLSSVARSDAVDAITQLAEDRRLALTSPLSGKRDVYILKGKLAKLALDGDAAAQALIDDEASERAMTGDDLRALILTKATVYDIAAMKIEKLEAKYKKAIIGALTRADIDAAAAAAKAAFAAVEG